MLVSRCSLFRLALGRSFARVAKKATGESFREKRDKKIKVQLKSDVRFVEEDERLDPNDPNIDEKTLSYMHLKPQMLPEK